MITPTESCSGEATWNTFPNKSGEGLPPIGCAMRTEVTYLERWPYSTNSLLPRIIGEAFWLPGVGGWSCACAWRDAMSPNVNPPANAAPLLRSSLRLARFEPIGSSFQSGFL